MWSWRARTQPCELAGTATQHTHEETQCLLPGVRTCPGLLSRPMAEHRRERASLTQPSPHALRHHLQMERLGHVVSLWEAGGCPFPQGGQGKQGRPQARHRPPPFLGPVTNVAARSARACRWRAEGQGIAREALCHLRALGMGVLGLPNSFLLARPGCGQGPEEALGQWLKRQEGADGHSGVCSICSSWRSHHSFVVCSALPSC